MTITKTNDQIRPFAVINARGQILRSFATMQAARAALKQVQFYLAMEKRG